MVAAPCTVSWETMIGDDTTRSCSGCNRNVYNISNMTASEAEKFLQENGARECLTFYRRSDGTIMTDNCPRGLRAIRDHYRKTAALVSSVIATFVSLIPAAKAQQDPSWEKVESKRNERIWERDPETGMKPRGRTSGQNWLKKQNPQPCTPLPQPLQQIKSSLIPAAPQAYGGGIAISPQLEQAPAPSDPGWTLTSRSYSPQIFGSAGSTKTKSKTKTVLMGGDQCKDSSGPAPTSQNQLEKGEVKQNRGTKIDGMTLPIHGDTNAFALYLQAKQNEAEGKFMLAYTQYRQALKLATSQRHDEKFINLVTGDYLNLKGRLALSEVGLPKEEGSD